MFCRIEGVVVDGSGERERGEQIIFIYAPSIMQRKLINICTLFESVRNFSSCRIVNSKKEQIISCASNSPTAKTRIDAKINSIQKLH